MDYTGKATVRTGLLLGNAALFTGAPTKQKATTLDLRSGLVLKTQIYSPRLRTDADSAAANRLWPSGCLWPKARRLRRPLG